jgi:membrane-associated protein
MFSGENLINLINTAGYIGIFAIIFAESGLFIGFFLPGDSLLFTAGFLASQGYFNVYILAALAFIGAVAGDSVGYSFGKKVGKRIFNKEDSLFFNKKNIIKAQKFYEKYGSKTIVFARFVPIVRTFAPIVAGVGEMKYKTFITYNLIGGALWTFGMTFGGYLLGNVVPDVDKYLLPIIALIIIISLLPTIREVILARKESKVESTDQEKL